MNPTETLEDKATQTKAGPELACNKQPLRTGSQLFARKSIDKLLAEAEAPEHRTSARFSRSTGALVSTDFHRAVLRTDDGPDCHHLDSLPGLAGDWVADLCPL
jgi:hypothetical protein